MPTGLLPVICWMFLFRYFGKTGASIREAFLLASVVWGVLVTGITEGLSLFEALRFKEVLFCWIVASAACAIIDFRTDNPSRGNLKTSLSGLSMKDKMLFWGIMGISGATLLTAVIAPPNTFDSMTYHMSRVMHWIQNGSIRNYTTSNLRQLHAGPWAESAITHFQILSGGDGFANLVQWFSMIGSLAAVSLIAEKWSNDRRAGIFSAMVAATLPMGILQSSSTQNDYVVTFWLIAFVCFSMRFMERPDIQKSIPVGVCIGLAALTKGTTYVFGLPFILYFGGKTIRKVHFKSTGILLCVIVIALALNAGFFFRNWNLYHNPLGPGKESEHHQEAYMNDDITISGTVSNLLRNAGLHMGVPFSGWNRVTEGTIRFFHHLMGRKTDDAKTSWIGSDFHVTCSLHEDAAGNPIHFFLFLGCLSLLVMRFRKNRMDEPTVFAILVVCAFFLFSMLLRWQPWHSRLHLPLFVLFCPVAGSLFSGTKWKRSGVIIGMLLIVSSLPWVFLNTSRPLIGCTEGRKSILNSDRLEQYFSNKPEIMKSYVSSGREAMMNGCNRIGIRIGRNDWEYPIWMLGKRMTTSRFTIEHVHVSNVSGKLSDNGYQPCTILKINRNGQLVVDGKWNHEWTGRYSDGWMGKEAILSIRSAGNKNRGTIVIRSVRHEKLARIYPFRLEFIGETGKTVSLDVVENKTLYLVPANPLISASDGDIRIRASKTWSPATLGISPDPRALSVQIDYEKE